VAGARCWGTTGASEVEPFWTAFLRSLADPGLREVKMVIDDDHKGLRAPASRVFHASHQRSRVHWMRSAMAHLAPKQRPAVVAMLKRSLPRGMLRRPGSNGHWWGTPCGSAVPSWESCWTARGRSYMSFPRTPGQIASLNPLERLNGEIKRRTDVVGIFPNVRAVIRVVGALLLKQNDEWAVSQRCMSPESLSALSDDPVRRLSAVTA
jgi:putative transposase